MERQSKEEYDKEPVFYCKHCLSLKIKDAGLDSLLYCDHCSSTDIELANIREWEQLYIDRYGFKYLQNTLK